MDLRNALRVIAREHNSTTLKNYLSSITDERFALGGPISPVGLQNSGNTCYLNSLLQFYFTIKPFRDMILNLDQYQEDELTPEVLARKRVGGRVVTEAEIVRSKECERYSTIMADFADENSCPSLADPL